MNSIKCLKDSIKNFFKSIVYLTCLILFVKCYLIHEFQSFLKGSTTFSSYNEETEYLDVPNFSFCIEPAFRPSKVEENGLSKSTVSYGKIRNASVSTKANSPWKLFQDVSYNSNSDFQVELHINRTKVNFTIQKVGTYRHGLCHIVQHDYKVPIKATGSINVLISFSSTITKSDFPINLEMGIHSRNGWHGMIVDDWPLIKPSKFEIPVQYGKISHWITKMSQTNYHYRNGVEDFESCFLKYISEIVNCTNKCFPIAFNIFSDELQQCTLKTDFDCMFRNLIQDRKHRYKCLKLKNITKYNIDSYYSRTTEERKTGAQIEMYFVKDTKEIVEEIFVVTTGNFIGSIGGSLGLFLGFSFFTYSSAILDKVF